MTARMLKKHRGRRYLRGSASGLMLGLLLLGCRPSRLTGSQGEVQPKGGQREDGIRLPGGAKIEDVHFTSEVLHHEVTYRVIRPERIPEGRKAAVLWLLHGSSGNYTDWSRSSEISNLTKRGVILVMPDAENSYFVNALSQEREQYETFFIKELIPDFYRRFPAADTDRAHTGIIGISRGGYGALVLGLRNPQRFSFIGSLSGTLLLAATPTPTRVPPNEQIAENWRKVAETFGPAGSATRRENDPFQLAETASRPLPYIYLVSNDTDGLAPSTHQFAVELKKLGISSEIHVDPGTHTWEFWNLELPGMEKRLLKTFGF